MAIEFRPLCRKLAVIALPYMGATQIGYALAFLGILSVETRKLVSTNAGHNPPYIR